MSVSIIGTRGCGKSTVIGLLYQSMEEYTNKNPENYIYYTAAEVGEKILDIRNNMLQGEYPAATTRHQLEQLQFLMGFRPRPHEKVVQFVKNYANFGKYGNYLGLIFTVYDISGEDIQEYKRSKSMSGIIRMVFDSNIVVIIVDCSTFTDAVSGRKYSNMLEYDKELAIILAAYAEYRHKSKLKEKLNPIFILAKVDALDNEIKSQFGIDKLARGYEREEAEKIGNELLQSYLSATRAAIYGAQKVGIPLEKARYFYSWVEEEHVDGVPEAGSMHKLKVEKPKGDVKHAYNVYPEHMYEEFLNHIKELSYLYSDPKKQVEEIFGRVAHE